MSQGYSSPHTAITDNHTAPNSASVGLNVSPLVAGAGPTITVRNPDGSRGAITLTDSVHASIGAAANAGVPTDGDKFHSADAFVGVELKATSTYIATAGTNPPIFHVLGRDLVALGGGAEADQNGNVEGALRDPFFLTVTDLNAGIATRQILMAENADYLNLPIVMDDTGIHLTVSRIVLPPSVGRLQLQGDALGS